MEPNADVAPGVYPIRIETPSGISNILLFTLGTYPEVTEEESQPNSPPNRNDSIETAEPVRSSPVVVNGTLRGPERDVYRVSGKAGERRVFEVEARRCGSAIDPVLRILDGAGKQLARSDDSPGTGLDARLDFTFPAEGTYYVEVTDARFSTQAQNFYRLKMGSYRYADGIFPLGGRRGGQTQVTLLRRSRRRRRAYHGGPAQGGPDGGIHPRGAARLSRAAVPFRGQRPAGIAGARGRHGARPERGQRPTREGRRRSIATA